MAADEHVLEQLCGELTADEKAGAVAYYATELLPEGEPLPAPGVQVSAPFDAFVGFVDREPTANWGHSSRYILVDPKNQEVVSIESQLPPFGPEARLQWRVAYKAPSVPDAAVAISR